MSKYLSVVVSAMCEVIGNDKLPSTFSVDRGLRFHLFFNAESHPAMVNKCNDVLSVGDVGEVDIVLDKGDVDKGDGGIKN